LREWGSQSISLQILRAGPRETTVPFWEVIVAILRELSRFKAMAYGYYVGVLTFPLWNGNFMDKNRSGIPHH